MFRDALRKAPADQVARLTEPGAASVPAADNAALLDALPLLDVDPSRLPEDLQRRLHRAFGLEVRYSRPGGEVTSRVTIPGHMVDARVAVTREMDLGNRKSGITTEVLMPDCGTRGERTGRNRQHRSRPPGAPGGGPRTWERGDPPAGRG
ncbi:hypothetical protein SSP531S_51450 [Streptomyces spongiicola]|uniref:Uncharacterized protein n=1 Tax=Streptomyces spongiicola TaxID=1690221 RepID=A0A388T6N4_9ACTN|nr:hypothetical protein SSP531S_51450 [Streptomyces spongiicola]